MAWHGAGRPEGAQPIIIETKKGFIMAKSKKKEVEKEIRIISIPPLVEKWVTIKVMGITSLIMQAFAESRIKLIESKQQGKVKKPKGPRKPEQEYCESLYWFDKKENRIQPGNDPAKHDGFFGIKAVAFKHAMIRAAKALLKIEMVDNRIRFHVVGNLKGGEFIKIEGKPRFHSSMRRIGQGTWDPVYRAEFVKWAAELKIRYFANSLSEEQIVNLVAHSGFAGVGELRPASRQGTGSNGMYRID